VLFVNKVKKAEKLIRYFTFNKFCTVVFTVSLFTGGLSCSKYRPFIKIINVDISIIHKPSLGSFELPQKVGTFG